MRHAGGPATPEERAAWLAGLRLVVDAAEAAFTGVLADFDTDGDGQVLHAAASTQSWLRGALGLAAGEASERVQIARHRQRPARRTGRRPAVSTHPTTDPATRPRASRAVRGSPVV